MTSIPSTNLTSTITTSQGAPVDSLTASQTAGPRGPLLVQDFTLLDHLAHFDRERIPERVVHAKGAGAFGYFEVTHSIGHICRAHVFQHVGLKTPIAVRCSTVGGESGSADAARDPRGFAVKFYTAQGNWDLVGNNTPIFFLRDPMLFPSFIHTQKRNPSTHLADPDAFWDFIGQRPETTHQVAFLFSDRGTPLSYRHMNGYGSHTFKNVNAQGEPSYVKYHFKTDQGIANLTAQQAQQLAADDPDSATRDLYNAIQAGHFPSWTLYIQHMTYEQAKACPFDPFDLTKVWPHADYPLQPVGRIVLDRNPVDYFAEIEQLAFSPSHMIPGIEPSPDKMLQARLFAYPDTQRHRLGANYHNIPVNQARVVNNYQRDGPMQTGAPSGPNYFPNAFGGPQPSKSCGHGDVLTGQVIREDTGDADNFSQCRKFWHMLDAAAQDRWASNVAQHMAGAQSFIRDRALLNFRNVEERMAQMIQDRMDRLPPARPQPQPAPRNPPACPFGYSSKTHGYGGKL